MQQDLHLNFINDDGSTLDPQVEKKASDQLSRWLAPIKNDLRKKAAVVNVFIHKTDIRNISFDNLTGELLKEAVKLTNPHLTQKPN